MSATAFPPAVEPAFVSSRPESLWADAWKRLRRNRAAVASAAFLVVLSAVCALAPWIVPGEPFEQLRGKALLIAHGDQERMTDPAKSLWFARQAKTVTDRVARFSVEGGGHAMVKRARDWTRLVIDFVHGELGLEPMAPDISNAMREASPRGLDVPLGGSRG